MRWAWAKIVALLGAGVAAVCAAGSAQGPAFVQAYLQRLGGHIDEATRTLNEFTGGAAGRLVGDVATRERLVAEFAGRVDELSLARSEITEAHPLMQPLALAAHADPEILNATWRAYTPAMPLDTPSLVYAGIGLAIGWLFWEAVQSPFRARARRRREARLMSGRS